MLRLGIDFGTTRTVVALCDHGNFPILSFEDQDGGWRDWFPTAIATDGEAWAYGASALDAARAPGWHLIRSLKRVMSDVSTTPDTRLSTPVGAFLVIDLITNFLRALRESLESSSTMPDTGGPLHVIAAIPARASSAQRLMTLTAFSRAGFHVDAMINEPTAAGIEYAHRWEKTFNSKRQDVLVFDLGGGTFDLSIVRMTTNSHQILISDGDPDLGGQDYDHALATLVCQDAGLHLDDLPSHDRGALLEHCREQKEQLNPSSRKLLVELGAALSPSTRTARGIDEEHTVIIQTSRFYQACAGLDARGIEVIEATLESLGLDGLEGIAGVYVVGGGSCLPCVARTLKAHYGRRIHRAPHPSGSTAVGLAMFAEKSDAGFEVHERLERFFGVFREGNQGKSVTFDPLLTRETLLPSPGQDPREFTRVYRPTHNIGHLRFVECTQLDESTNPSGKITPYSEVRFPYVPELRNLDLSNAHIERLTAEGPRIQEKYVLRPGGVIELEITDLDASFSKHFEIRNAAPQNKEKNASE